MHQTFPSFSQHKTNQIYEILQNPNDHSLFDAILKIDAFNKRIKNRQLASQWAVYGKTFNTVNQ